jgi:DNA-binding GntR family transcriptional regulator
MRRDVKGGRSRADEVYGHLRDAIVRGDLRPGDRILELKVARDHGVSQAPVREALLRLRQDSLVASDRYKGTFVAGFSLQETVDLYALRVILDEFALRRAMEYATEDEMQRVAARYEAIEEAAVNGDVEDLWRADIDFHDYIYELARHETLYQTWRTVCHKISRAWYLTNQAFYPHLPEIARLHYPILEALRQRDPAKVKHASEYHLLNIRLRLAALMDGDGQPPDQA